MKIIISCAGKKSQNAMKLRDSSGKEIIFVSNPDLVKDKCKETLYFRPDDLITSQKRTWREFLVDYNNQGDNPLNLVKAAELYKPKAYPKIYLDLVLHFGWENVFILSAGWGLIRSDYFLPYYDITFSSQCKLGSRRYKNDTFNDFDYFPQNIIKSEEIYFFGSDNYLPLLYFLMDQKKCKNDYQFLQTKYTQDG